MRGDKPEALTGGVFLVRRVQSHFFSVSPVYQTCPLHFICEVGPHLKLLLAVRNSEKQLPTYKGKKRRNENPH